MGICDRIINEPLGGAHRNPDRAAKLLKKTILAEINNFKDLDRNSFLESRIERYNQMGAYSEIK